MKTINVEVNWIDGKWYGLYSADPESTGVTALRSIRSAHDELEALLKANGILDDGDHLFVSYQIDEGLVDDWGRANTFLARSWEAEDEARKLRHSVVTQLAERGVSQADMGALFGLSQQRIQQLLKAMKPTDPRDQEELAEGKRKRAQWGTPLLDIDEERG